MCSTEIKHIVRKRVALCIFVLVLCRGSAIAADTRISGKEAEAVAIAVGIFKSKQGSKVDGLSVYGDLRHYSVQVERTQNRLEITFVPEQPPLKPNEAGTGGSTVYGWEVAYVFSLSPLKVIEEHYAR
jgi:hypothetical protein